MPGIIDWTMDPLSIIDKIYDDCKGNNEWIQKVVKCFEEKFQDEAVISTVCSIPETPLHELRNGQLVRFRCQVQDQYDPEYFMSTYQVKDKAGNVTTRPCFFRELLDCKADEQVQEQQADGTIAERTVNYCISLPGQNTWVTEALKPSAPPRDGGDSNVTAGKRPLDSDEEEDMETQDSAEESSKRARVSVDTTTSSATAANTSTAAPFNFPVPNDKGIACLVKFYNDMCGDIAINDVFEVVGVIGLDPSVGGHEDDMDTRGPACQQPSSLVPRLHAVACRPLPHSHPSLSPLASPPTPSTAREARELLRSVLEEACLGDPLVGDYLVCCLMGSVYSRQDIETHGQFPLNVSGVSAALSEAKFPSRLYGLLQQLTSHSHFVPFSVQHLNSTKFIPKKDYTRNCLVSGSLQLPRHTLLTVNETAMAAGTLQQAAILSLEQLANVLRNQKCQYDFQYHKIEFNTNLNVLVLSEGKSMLPCCSEVILQPEHDDVEGAFSRVQTMLTNDALAVLRSYIATARLRDYKLTDHMQKSLQDEFVDARKDDKAALSPETFHQQLVMARLVSVSCGESELTHSVWHSCKILETKREERITALNRPQPTLGQRAL